MIVFSQKSCSSAAGNPHIFLPQFQLKLHQQQQLRHLHRILNRNPPFVASKEAQGGGHYFPLPACPPISAAISIESSSASSPSSSSFRLANVPVPTPQFPMSNGLGPTPSPATWNPTSKSSSCRRVGLIGRKMGMTSFWDEWGRIRPVTILQIQDNQVIHTRYEAQISSWMVKIGAINYESIKNVPPTELPLFRRFLINPKREIMEFPVSPDACLPSGLNLNAAHFLAGQYVDCQAITRGKGFQGVMKRWGFAGQPASHGVSITHRSGGSTGHSTTPGKVFKGKKMPGRMGGNLSTAQSLRILKIDPHANLIFVAGAVAGPELGIVRITDAVRKLQNGKCFPTTTTTANGSGGSDFIVPYPTFMGNVADLPNELLPPLPEGKAALALDPFLKQVNEI